MMTVNEYHSKLRIIRQRLFWQQFLECAVRAVNKAMMMACFWIGLMLIMRWPISFSGKPFEALTYSNWMIMGVWTAVVLYWMIMHKPEVTWQESASYVDQESNTHDYIRNGYDLACSEVNTRFGHHARIKGLRFLKDMGDVIAPAVNVPFSKRNFVILAGMVVLFQYGNTVYSPIEAAINHDEGKESLDVELQTVISQNDKQYINNQVKPNHHVSQSIKSENGIYERGHSLEANHSMAASAIQSRHVNSMKRVADSVIRSMKSPTGHNERMRVTQAGQSAGIRDFNESTIKSGDLHSGNASESDNKSTETKDREMKKNASTMNRMPFRDDRRAAPGRELGRSGKKGKAGNGRGGQGGMKKSRTTATIVTGKKIPVFLKSRANPGRTKSFSLKEPLQSVSNHQPEMSGRAVHQEAVVDAPYLNEQLRDIAKFYFEGMNNDANRMH